MKTIIDVLNSGASFLERHGCDEPRAIMQHLMAHILQCNRTWLYTHFDEPLTEDQLSPLRELLKRKANGEPMQHLIGSTEFYRREFLSDSRALIPRPETEELVELILPHARRAGDGLRILDMGTGSGVIGITLSLELGESVSETVLADKSPVALDLALENAVRTGAKVSVIQTDLFSAFYQLREEDKSGDGDSPDDRFDIIAANLPYIPEGEILQREVGFDPSLALYGGEKGWELIELFLRQAPDFLRPNGFVALETGHDQENAVRGIMAESRYRDITVGRDMAGVPRFPLAWAPASHSE